MILKPESGCEDESVYFEGKVNDTTVGVVHGGQFMTHKRVKQLWSSLENTQLALA